MNRGHLNHDSLDLLGRHLESTPDLGFRRPLLSVVPNLEPGVARICLSSCAGSLPMAYNNPVPGRVAGGCERGPMKIPLKWLNDYVPLTTPVGALAEWLTLAGLEVSGARCLGQEPPAGLRVKSVDPGPPWERDKVLTAQVLRVEQHPNANKLLLVTVDYGAAEPKVFVTGAPNIKVGDVGQKVIVGLCGFTYFDGHVTPKQLKQLQPTQLRGIPSDAMLCSSFELGIDEEHEGIILLEPEAPVGVPLADFMGDIVFEVEVTPNLARCLSLIGVAREVAALTDQQLTLPSTVPEATGDPIEGQVQVEIADARLAPRYAAALLKNVTLGPAPGWMQRRLTYAGMRPINNIVDVTNYVMLEWGQPLHAFDYDKLVARAEGRAPTIIVRPATPEERLKTLDGVDRKLTPDMLVIADTAGPIALAGVMGGAETEVSAKTTNVLLESASFDFVSIRRTSRALDLPSEASARFSRGIHPEMVGPALGRASELLRQHAGATVCRGLVDVYPAPVAPQVIDLSMGQVRRLLGADVPLEECVRILRGLEFRVETVGSAALRATVPPHRLDIQSGAPDLIEDIARLRGYDKLPATLLADELPAQSTNEELVFEERVRDLLVSVGLQEVITYALTTPEREAPLGLPAAEYVRLLNPINADRVAMRQSVLAGVLEVLSANLRHAADVRLFEVGSIYRGRAGEKLPEEPRRLALALCGRRSVEFWGETGVTAAPLDFFDLKGVLETLIAGLHLPKIAYRREPVPALHPGRSAALVVDGVVAGHFGELHPKVAEAFGLGGRAVLAGELDLTLLREAVPAAHRYVSVGRFPAALRDVAIVVAEEVTAERVEAEVWAAGGSLLRGVRLFDLYRGDAISAGHKSLAYALTYQADDHTLTEKEVEQAHKKIEERLRQVLQAQIRGQDASKSS